MRIILFDDETLSLEINKVYMKAFLQEKKIEKAVISSFTSYNRILDEKIRNCQIDIAILDIDMKTEKIDGIMLAEKIQQYNANTVIIFITSHLEYALNAFQVLAIGFLPKPYSQEQFFKVMNKAWIQYLGVMALSQTSKMILLGRQYYDAARIVYLEKQKNKVLIHTHKKMLEVLSAMYAVKEQLPSYFIQIERGILVNAYYIEGIAEHRVYLSIGEFFHIPDRKYKKVMEEYHAFLESKQNVILK